MLSSRSCIVLHFIFKLLYDHIRAALIAQLVKNLPAIQETLVPFLGWEDPLEKGKATHWPGEIPWTV